MPPKFQCMPPNKALKYLLDMEAILGELREIRDSFSGDFEAFEAHFMAVRAVERGIEILGEALRKLLLNSSVSITNSRQIIGMRNIIAHAYDTVEPAALWYVLHHDIDPLLKEIQDIKNA